LHQGQPTGSTSKHSSSANVTPKLHSTHSKINPDRVGSVLQTDPTESSVPAGSPTAQPGTSTRHVPVTLPLEDHSEKGLPSASPSTRGTESPYSQPDIPPTLEGAWPGKAQQSTSPIISGEYHAPSHKLPIPLSTYTSENSLHAVSQLKKETTASLPSTDNLNVLPMQTSSNAQSQQPPPNLSASTSSSALVTTDFQDLSSSVTQRSEPADFLSPETEIPDAKPVPPFVRPSDIISSGLYSSSSRDPFHSLPPRRSNLEEETGQPEKTQLPTVPSRSRGFKPRSTTFHTSSAATSQSDSSGNKDRGTLEIPTLPRSTTTSMASYSVIPPSEVTLSSTPIPGNNPIVPPWRNETRRANTGLETGQPSKVHPRTTVRTSSSATATSVRRLSQSDFIEKEHQADPKFPIPPRPAATPVASHSTTSRSEEVTFSRPPTPGNNPAVQTLRNGVAEENV